MKKSLLISMLIAVLVFSLPACKKKKAEDKKSDDTKKTADLKEVKKSGISFSSEIDYSSFSKRMVLLGSIDFKKILNLKQLKPIIEPQLKSVKEMGLDLSQIGFISYSLNSSDDKNILNYSESGVAIVNNLLLPEKFLIEKFNVKLEDKIKYEGITLYKDGKGNDAVVASIANATVIGDMKSVKEIIDIKKGKVKGLASLNKEKVALFKDVLSKTNNSDIKVAVVADKNIQESLKKASESPQLAMFSDFFKNLVAVSGGIKLNEKDMKIYLNAKSSEAGVNIVLGMIKPQLAVITQDNSPMLSMAESQIGKDGVKILQETLKTLKIEKSGEYLLVSFSVKYEHLLKAPELVGGAIMGSALKK